MNITIYDLILGFYKLKMTAEVVVSVLNDVYIGHSIEDDEPQQVDLCSLQQELLRMYGVVNRTVDCSTAAYVWEILELMVKQENTNVH